MGDPNKIKYDLGGSDYPQQNLISNSGFGVCSQSTLENTGAQITLTDVTSGVCLTANTQGISVGALFRFNSGNFNNQIFVIAAVTPNVSFTLNDTSKTDTGSPGTGFEATPGFIAANGNAFDGWDKRTNATNKVYREYGSPNVKDGSLYGARLVNTEGVEATMLNYPKDLTLDTHWKKFVGRTISYGLWVKADSANAVRISFIVNGSSTVFSNYNVGTGWEWLEITDTPNITSGFGIGVRTSHGSNVYISQPMLVFGSSIGEGNYSPIPNEIISLISRVVDWSEPISTNISLDLELLTNGRIPKNVKNINVNIWGASSSGVGNFLSIVEHIAISNNSGVKVFNQVSAVNNSNHGWVKVNSDSTIAIVRSVTFSAAFSIHDVKL